jgi:FeS assembly SUF system protein
MTELSDKKALKEAVIEELKTVFDPEVPVNIWELGLIYEINVTDNKEVNILMTLTSPNCPVAESLPMEVQQKAAAVPGVKEADVELTFEPSWDETMISDEGKFELGML